VRNVARVGGHIAGIDGAPRLGGDSGDALAKWNEEISRDRAVAELSPDEQLLRGFLEQHDAAVLQMEIVTDDGEDLVEDLVEIERGQDRLAGVVEDGNSLHT